MINKGLNMVSYIEFFCLAPDPNPPDPPKGGLITGSYFITLKPEKNNEFLLALKVREIRKSLPEYLFLSKYFS